MTVLHPSLRKVQVARVIGGLLIVLSGFAPFGAVLFVFGWIAILVNRDRQTLMLGIACTLVAVFGFVLNATGTSLVVTDVFG